MSDPVPPLATPAAPGRPAELRFKVTGTARGEFPGIRHLEQERERGRLLHFFANHELLATELMALVLLRFPDAPAAFRKGVLQTLKDEQEHTRLYLQRMKECGIHFGELPVSGYFWRSVSVDGKPDGLRLQPVPDVRAGQPGFRPAFRARLCHGGRRRPRRSCSKRFIATKSATSPTA